MALELRYNHLQSPVPFHQVQFFNIRNQGSLIDPGSMDRKMKQ